MEANDPLMTQRLVLTPVGLDDVNDLVMLHGDTQVALWTGPWTNSANTAWAEDMAARWAAEGVGKWMARSRLDGGLVGRGGFTRMNLNDEQVLELGWTVRDALTDRGYATEIGRAAIEWAAECENGVPIVSFTEVHNQASLAVMRRLGMQPAGSLYRNGLVQGQPGIHASAPFALYRLRTTPNS